ncbi:FGGY-family carbohydrate kinase [Terrimonas pollutisoli]|uniref:FGGY-family carbohydrate kinase n=1 Tax=Terrimonas pollutisoli TaxID=3034147 RepID=UPI0023EC75B0|nr:FGGY family carbohydrate kinase [Terrimonas sp. H1YJ31]
MKRIPAIAIFDVGKTNKKLVLFDEQYKLVYEESRQFEEIKDEDGFACEDVAALARWVKGSFTALLGDKRFDIRAVNFSAYGASFVYLNNDLEVTGPLYNYLKPYSAELQKQFYNTYGTESTIARQTASPVLGSLNSGMQLYRLKHEKPAFFAQIKWALHLPQYLSHVLTSGIHTDITSVGCHTALWNFQYKKYHRWVKSEGIEDKFAPILGCTEIAGYTEQRIPGGAGLHDSSAALIPYLASFNEPFILLSTGTWCISLNPFNHAQLTNNELNHDCLCYLSYEGKPVKASRLFAGYEHEQQVKRLAAHFNVASDYYSGVKCDTEILKKLKPLNQKMQGLNDKVMVGQSAFAERDLAKFSNYEKAYHQLIADIIQQQVKSTSLVLKGTMVKRIFVDGGFSKNSIYMYLLAKAFPSIEVYAASVAQASSLGAALAIHPHWNNKPLPADIIELKLFSVNQAKVSG